jgi:hypothetical protein
MKGLIGTLAVAGALAFAGAAHAESIVYVMDGDLYLTNIERTVRLTDDGGYESPSQDAAGRIIAVRRTEEGQYTNRRIYRFDVRGNQLNDPVVAVDVNNSLEVGPLGAEVSPDGQIVAYHYFNHAPTIPQNQRPRLSFSYSTRDTDQTEIEEQGYYLNPTWLNNNNVAIFVDGDFVQDVQIYTLGGTFTDWFRVDGAILTSGDVSQDLSRFVAVADGGAHLLFYSLEAPPPAAPTFRCGAEGPEGKFASASWSPDGLGLAWQQPDGIHLATVGADLSACQVQEVAVIPGGEAPYWGNASLPAAPVVCNVTIPNQVKRRKAKRAIKVKIACPGAPKAKGTAVTGGETVAKGSQTLDEGLGTLKIKPTRDGKPLLTLADKVRVKVNVGGKRFSRKVKITG